MNRGADTVTRAPFESSLWPPLALPSPPIPDVAISSPEGPKGIGTGNGTRVCVLVGAHIQSSYKVPVMVRIYLNFVFVDVEMCVCFFENNFDLLN